MVALNFYGQPLALRLDQDLGDTALELVLSSTSKPLARIEGDVVRLAPFEAAVFVAGESNPVS